MKKIILLINVLLFMLVTTFGQQTTNYALRTLRAKSVEDKQLLDKVSQLHASKNFSSIEIVEIEDLEKSLRDAQVSFDLPIKGVRNVQTQKLDYKNNS